MQRDTQSSQKGVTMLGVVSPREPIVGRFAQEVRDTLTRLSSGNLNEADRERQAFRKQDAKVKIVKGF